eukprot:6766487-Alexandrium_andersonii.AAC.1
MRWGPVGSLGVPEKVPGEGRARYCSRVPTGWPWEVPAGAVLLSPQLMSRGPDRHLLCTEEEP